LQRAIGHATAAHAADRPKLEQHRREAGEVGMAPRKQVSGWKTAILPIEIKLFRANHVKMVLFMKNRKS
jgi:hypothetical protein